MTDTETHATVRAKETQAPIILGLSIAPTVLSCISVALRLYTRKCVLHLIAAEDYVIVVAQVLAVGVMVLNIIQVVWGHLGRHMEFATEAELLKGSQSLLAVILIYNAAQIFTKISFLLQYRRVFPGRNIQAVSKWGIVFLGVWGVAQQIYTPFSCIPLRGIFPDTTVCFSDKIAFQLNAVMNMLTDIVILVIPIGPVLKLQVNKRRKAYLLVVFCFGFVACAISAVRLHELRRTDALGDDTWNTTRTAYLSTIEISIGILCACVPTLRPLLKKISPALIGSSDGTGEYGRSYRLGTSKSIPTLKNKETQGSGIYIHKAVEFHSTTELRHNPKDPYSIPDRSSEEISLGEEQMKAKGST